MPGDRLRWDAGRARAAWPRRRTRPIERLAAGGFKTVLVSGRTGGEPGAASFRELAVLFDRVVAENGAILFRSSRSRQRGAAAIASRRPTPSSNRFGQRGVGPLDIGQVIVATDAVPSPRRRGEPIAALGVALDVILDKRLVMILPAGRGQGDRPGRRTGGVESLGGRNGGRGRRRKRRGHAGGLRPGSRGGQRAALRIEAAADWVTRGEAGQGVIELVERLLARRNLRLETWGLR